MSRLTRARNLCLAAAAATAALGAFVSTGAASSSSSRSTQINHSVRFSGLRAYSAASGYVYLVSAKFSIAKAHTGGGTIKCPSKAPHPIGGQFVSNSPSVLPNASFRSGTTGWTTGLSNFGSTTATAQVGVVCAP